MERLRLENEIAQLGLLGSTNRLGGFGEAELGLIGGESRQEVTDTRIRPYCWTCSVTFEKDGATHNGGSGVLISDRHVLTAGHVIQEGLSGPYRPSLIVYPGRHYGGEFGRFTAKKIRKYRNLTALDFGLITLSRRVPDELKWWGHPSTASALWDESLPPLKDLQHTPTRIFTAGFPRAWDAQRRRMVSDSGETVPEGFGATFRHTADTTKGQSGSPIWVQAQDRTILLGIATRMGASNNFGVSLHGSTVRDHIDRWIEEDRPKPATPKKRPATEIPYRWVCRLEVRDNDLKRVVGYGTGLLIGERHVLSSASVIHAFSKDRRRYSVLVTPGYEFGGEPFSSSTASEARMAPGFSVDAGDASKDYGLLTLARPLGSAKSASIGNAPLGYWGGPNHDFSSSAADWTGKDAHLAAFSRASGGGGGYHRLRISKGSFAGLNGGQIVHRAGSKLDAPGAPIWTEASGRRLLVGITSNFFSNGGTTNLACYLNAEASSHLMRWIKQ